MWGSRNRFQQANKQHSSSARKACRRSSGMGWQSRFAGQKCSQSLSLMPVQDGDRSRSARIKDIALLSDNSLDSLGEIVRQCFVKLAIPTQSLLQLLVLLGKKSGGSRTLAILHTTYRLTMRLVSAHIRQCDVKFPGKWDSALQGNSAHRAHVARAGIGLAHSEGQHVIHFLWDMRKFYDSIKAHSWWQEAYPLEILVLGSLTQIAEMSSSW